MPRPLGSLNKKGRQSTEERKAKRKASKKANSAESRQREYAKRNLERREKQIEKLNQRIREKRQQLHSVGRFAGTEDPLLKELAKILDGWIESKLEFISTNGHIELEESTDLAHLNRVAMMIFHCKLQHEAKECRKKTLPKFIQGEL